MAAWRLQDYKNVAIFKSSRVFFFGFFWRFGKMRVRKMILLFKAAEAEATWLLWHCEGRWFNPLACSCVFVQVTQRQYSSRSCICYSQFWHQWMNVSVKAQHAKCYTNTAHLPFKASIIYIISSHCRAVINLGVFIGISAVQICLIAQNTSIDCLSARSSCY